MFSVFVLHSPHCTYSLYYLIGDVNVISNLANLITHFPSISLFNFISSERTEFGNSNLRDNQSLDRYIIATWHLQCKYITSYDLLAIYMGEAKHNFSAM